MKSSEDERNTSEDNFLIMDCHLGLKRNQDLQTDCYKLVALHNNPEGYK